MRFLGIVAGLVVLACGAAAPSGSAAGLTLLGAASLTDVLTDIGSEWTATHGGSTLTYSTGSSTALRTQIEQGAPADVFLSADTSNPQVLVDAGLTDDQVVPFAANRLVIIVPRGNPGGIESAADLGRDGVCLIAAGENVPISRYATELVAVLADAPGSPEDLTTAYEANICSREDDVRAVVTKVELGEGDAAIVYATDSLSADVDTIDLPPGVEVKATYGGVVLDRASNLQAAHELLDWIAGPEGQEIMSSRGFAPAD